MKMKIFKFLCQTATNCNFSGYVRDFHCFWKSTFFRNKRGFVLKHIDEVVIWSLSLDSLKVLERYINIFKMQLSLIFYYFPFSWTINFTI